MINLKHMEKTRNLSKKLKPTTAKIHVPIKGSLSLNIIFTVKLIKDLNCNKDSYDDLYAALCHLILDKLKI